MVTCNRGCGADNLRWKSVSGKYKLFNHNDLLHICNDGVQASEIAQQKATASILHDLGLNEPTQIPLVEETPSPTLNLNNNVQRSPSKMFTINSTASGLAITGDDKHNAIYIPRVAVTELMKALIDFI